MTFAPAIGAGGLAGYRLLEKSQEKQRAAFENSSEIKRNVAYFEANIGKATTAADLVKDRKLLQVALGAFGLGDEIDKKAYLQKILEGGTTDSKAYARRVADARILEFTKTFGYGDGGGSLVQTKAFREDIVARYKQLEFERSVGQADGDIRLALNFRREIAKIANGDKADEIGVLQALGQRPVREFLTAALGLPTSLARLDLDRQKAILEQGLKRRFGDDSVAVFKDAKKIDDAVRLFFAQRQSQSTGGASASATTALSILSGRGSGSANLLLSNG